MYNVFLILVILFMPVAAKAVDAPAAQKQVGLHEVLRGAFNDQRQVAGVANPVETSGHFVVSPSRGLLWMIEKPFVTSTIITRTSMAQDLGGLAIKLPAKNLQHVYEMVAGALAGNWDALDADFSVSRSATNGHWQMLLTAKPNAPDKLSYASIAVSGAAFVDDIVMTKPDGSHDVIHFDQQALSRDSLNAQEVAMFQEVKP